MNKLLVMTVLVTLGFVTIVKAQDIDFGIKTGINFANFSGDDSGSFDGVIGLHAGVVVDISLLEKFSLQPELIYSSQGGEFSGISTLKLDYLSMPILAKYYLFKGFSIEAGPQFSFLLDSKYEGLNGNPDGVFDGKDLDIAGAVGLGFKLPFGLFTQARYVIGVNSTDELFDLKNNVFQLSVGYKF